MSPPMYYVPIELGIGGEQVVITDKRIIEKCKPIRKAIKLQYKDWRDKGVVMDIPIRCTKVSREAAEFVFQHLTTYVLPSDRNQEPTVDKFPEANSKTPDQLKEILRFGEFLQLKDFQNCICLVLAPKIKNWETVEILKFMNFNVPMVNVPDEGDPKIEDFHLRVHPNAPLLPTVAGVNGEVNGVANGENGAANGDNGDGNGDDGDANGDDEVIDVKN